MRSRRVTGYMAAASMLAISTVAVTTWLQTSAAQSVVRLHLGTDRQQFSFGSTTQTLTTQKNSCAINSAQPLIVMTSTGNQSAPGLASYGIGVKGSPSSGNGSPCGQIDAAEKLTLTPGTSLGTRLFSALRFDLEMTGNAIVVLTVSRGSTTQTYQLQTGASITAAQTGEADYDATAPYTVSSTPTDNVDACAAPNSSGPNSNFSDNCQWSITPGFNFDKITITTTTGTATLKGAGDFNNDSNYDSLFYLSNSAPVPVTDNVSTDEDTATTFNVLTNDSDGDGDSLTATKLTDPANGTVVANAAAGSFTYTPTPDYNGTDSFTYIVSDGTNSATGTVNITVNAVNDAPVAVDDTAEVNRDQSVLIDVVGNDSDIDADTLTATNISTPSHGTAVATVGGITYTPAAGYSGTDSFTYTANDGTVDSANTATVSITIFPVLCSNDTVTASDGSVIGSFTRLSDALDCKRYTLGADGTAGTVLFQPSSGGLVHYRAYVSFGPAAAPTLGSGGTLDLLLQYDPDGGFTFQPVLWCGAPQFDVDGNVTSATIPAGETWCIASETTKGASGGNLVTTWQVYGLDDPRFQ